MTTQFSAESTTHTPTFSRHQRTVSFFTYQRTEQQESTKMSKNHQNHQKRAAKTRAVTVPSLKITLATLS